MKLHLVRDKACVLLSLLISLGGLSKGATVVNFHDLTDSVTVDTTSTSAVLTQGIESATFSDSFTQVNLLPIGLVTGTIDLLEPDGSVSDIIELTLDQGALFTTVMIRFTSDSESGPALAKDPNALSPMEPAGIHDYAPLFRGIGQIGDILPADWTINAESDVSDVREPGTLILPGMVLAAMAVSRRRKP